MDFWKLVEGSARELYSHYPNVRLACIETRLQEDGAGVNDVEIENFHLIGNVPPTEAFGAKEVVVHCKENKSKANGWFRRIWNALRAFCGLDRIDDPTIDYSIEVIEGEPFGIGSKHIIVGEKRECFPMVPYFLVTPNNAVELIKEQKQVEFNGKYFFILHPMDDGAAEPCYFMETTGGICKVGVWSGTVKFMGEK